jgi:molybdate transport system regulatory protein
MTSLHLRIDFTPQARLGPGKVRLLELIAEHGSISAAGRAMGVSYRRAWLLVDDLNRCFREPLVMAQMGGTGGGGTSLTSLGKEIVRRYRGIESAAAAAAKPDLAALEEVLSEEARDACREVGTDDSSES